MSLSAPVDLMPASRRHARRTAPVAGGYRTDIDGLRALAILLVVVYHVWLGRVSGGVDVFLMLSAFFLTGSFVRRIESGKPLALAAYWARTFKRLVPVSAVVLLGVLVTASVVYPPSQWPTIWSQTRASLLYFQNWELAANAVDYYAPDGALTSPLQHSWSLSVQGQIFVLWPLLLLLAAVIVRQTRARVTPVLLVIFGTVFVASLTFSVIETAADQQLAYFDSRTRLWEFALGSLVALALPHFRAPDWLRSVLGWVGLAGIVVCGIVLDVRGGFPGYFALWPTLCAAAVILGGSRSVRSGPSMLLSWRPLCRLGRDAYALYLVHWPILITWLVVRDRTEVGILGGLLLIGLSIVLARVLTSLVESPLRTWRWSNVSSVRGLVVIVAAVLVVVVPLTAWQVTEQRKADALVAGADTNNPGAAALLPAFEAAGDPAAPTLPLATTLGNQWVSLGGHCTGRFAPQGAELRKACGQTSPEGTPTKTVVILGDSHAEQFMGALIPVAERNGWQLVSLLKGACSLGLDAGKCPEWNAQVIDYTLGVAPDAVFTVATAAQPGGGPGETVVPGLENAAEKLTAAGIEVIGVRDNPRFSRNIFACVEELGANDPACSAPRAQAFAATNPAAPLAAIDGVHLVDLTDFICPDDACAPVVGNVSVYLDDNHLTWTYATTLAPVLGQELDESLTGW